MDITAANIVNIASYKLQESMFYIANRLIDPGAHFNIKINCKKRVANILCIMRLTH